MKKPIMIVTDIYEMMTGKDAYTLWHENKATDMIMTGRFMNEQGEQVYACILLTSKVSEAAAQKVINDTYTDIIRPQGYRQYLMSWIPMNDMKEMVLCDLEKDSGERVSALAEIMERTGAFRIMREFPGCAEAADIMYKKATA